MRYARILGLSVEHSNSFLSIARRSCLIVAPLVVPPKRLVGATTFE